MLTWTKLLYEVGCRGAPTFGFRIGIISLMISLQPQSHCVILPKIDCKISVLVLSTNRSQSFRNDLSAIYNLNINQTLIDPINSLNTNSPAVIQTFEAVAIFVNFVMKIDPFFWNDDAQVFVIDEHFPEVRSVHRG